MSFEQQRRANTSTSTQSGQVSSGNAAIDQLTNQPDMSNVEVGEMDSGLDFANVAGRILDASAPGEGSKTQIKIKGTLPLYKAPAVDIKFSPSIEISVERKQGKLSSSLKLAAQFKATLGTEGSWWYPQFQAFVETNFSGTLAITGDSGVEIFNEFLLTLRYVMEQACEATGAPSDITEYILTGIMTDAAMEDTLEGMDERDRVQFTMAAGASTGVDTSFGGGSVGATISQTQTLSRNQRTGALQTSSSTSSGVNAAASLGSTRVGVSSTNTDGQNQERLQVSTAFPLLGQSVRCAGELIFQNDLFRSGSVSGTISREMTLAEFGEDFMMDTQWILRTVRNLSQGLNQLNARQNNTNIRYAAARLGAMALSEDAIEYTPFGNRLRTARRMMLGIPSSLTLEGKVELKFDQNRQWAFAVTLSSTTSSSIDVAGVSFERTQSTPIMTLKANEGSLSIS